MTYGDIWIFAADLETGRHVKKVFDEAHFLNSIRDMEKTFDFAAHFREGSSLPVIALIDLGLPQEKAWDILAAAQGTKAEGQVCFIALVEDATEHLMDRAYEAGVKSYLGKPLTFSQFLDRARLLEMKFLLALPG